MRALLSKDVLLSIRDVISLKDQTDRSKAALQTLPSVITHVKRTLLAAPYLIFAYLIIAGIDVQYRLVQPTAEVALFSSFVSLALLTAANALCYVEVNNTYRHTQRITKTGWYVTRRVFRLAGVIMLSAGIVMVGLVMFIIPGLYFSLKLSLASPACLIEDAGIRESMRLSIDATKGQHTLIYTTFSFFGILFLPILILMIFSTGWLNIFTVFVLFGLYPPVLHTTLAVLYLNGSEENDVELEAADIAGRVKTRLRDLV